jgi:hypothetical protein
LYAGAVLEPNTVDGHDRLQALKAAKYAAERQYEDMLAAGKCTPNSDTYMGDHVFAINGGKTPLL